MKKILYLTLVLILCLGFCTVSTFAANYQITNTIDTSANTNGGYYANDSTFDVVVAVPSLSDKPNSFVQYIMTYDAAKVQFVSSTDNTLINSATAGRIKYVAHKNNSDHSMTYTFKVIGATASVVSTNFTISGQEAVYVDTSNQVQTVTVTSAQTSSLTLCNKKVFDLGNGWTGYADSMAATYPNSIIKGTTTYAVMANSDESGFFVYPSDSPITPIDAPIGLYVETADPVNTFKTVVATGSIGSYFNAIPSTDVTTSYTTYDDDGLYSYQSNRWGWIGEYGQVGTFYTRKNSDGVTFEKVSPGDFDPSFDVDSASVAWMDYGGQVNTTKVIKWNLAWSAWRNPHAYVCETHYPGFDVEEFMFLGGEDQYKPHFITVTQFTPTGSLGTVLNSFNLIKNAAGGSTINRLTIDKYGTNDLLFQNGDILFKDSATQKVYLIKRDGNVYTMALYSIVNYSYKVVEVVTMDDVPGTTTGEQYLAKHDTYNPGTGVKTGTVTYTYDTNTGSAAQESSSEVVTNPDGSTTETETKTDGTVTEIVTNTDGSTKSTETKPSGTVTETKTDTSGNVTEQTTTYTDGSKVEYTADPSTGSTTTTITDTNSCVETTTIDHPGEVVITTGENTTGDVTTTINASTGEITAKNEYNDVLFSGTLNKNVYSDYTIKYTKTEAVLTGTTGTTIGEMVVQNRKNTLLPVGNNKYFIIEYHEGAGTENVFVNDLQPTQNISWLSPADPSYFVLGTIATLYNTNELASLMQDRTTLDGAGTILSLYLGHVISENLDAQKTLIESDLNKDNKIDTEDLGLYLGYLRAH